MAKALFGMHKFLSKVRQLEDLANVVLDHVYAENIARWNTYQKRISARLSRNGI